jgi:hypothetical protein
MYYSFIDAKSQGFGVGDTASFGENPSEHQAAAK